MRKLTVLAVVSALLVSCTTVDPISASGPTSCYKEGRASSLRLLGAVIRKDGSIEAAAADGHIDTVCTVNVETQNYLGLVVIHTTIVRGK